MCVGGETAEQRADEWKDEGVKGAPIADGQSEEEVGPERRLLAAAHRNGNFLRAGSPMKDAIVSEDHGGCLNRDRKSGCTDTTAKVSESFGPEFSRLVWFVILMETSTV